MKRFYGLAAALIFAASTQTAHAQQAPGSFNGFYAGVTLGGANSRLGNGTSPYGFSEPNQLFFGFRSDDYQASRNWNKGFIGGSFIGYNFSLNNAFVFGLEADISLTSIKRTLRVRNFYSTGLQIDPDCGYTHVFPPNPNACPPLPADTSATTYLGKLELNGMATLRGRLGYSLGNSLVYITAGPAFSLLRKTTYSLFESSTVLPVSIQSSQQKIVMGASVGLGLEHQLSGNLRLRAEYLYYDFGSQRVTYSNGAQHKVGVNGHLGRLGLVWGF